MSVVSAYIRVESFFLFFSVRHGRRVFETADFLNRQLLHPLSVNSAAGGVLVQEASHLQDVVVLLLCKGKVGSHCIANILPHFVQSFSEDSQIILGQELLDLGE